jgi:hypothetical protein
MASAYENGQNMLNNWPEHVRELIEHMKPIATACGKTG